MLKNYRKCAILIFVISPFLDEFPINSALTVYALLVIALLLCYPFNMNLYKKEYITSCPFYWYFLALFFSYFITDIFSSVHHIPSVIISTIKSSINIIILWEIFKNGNIKYLSFFLKVVLYFGAIISIYGIIETVTQSNPYLDLMKNAGYYPYENEVEIRFGLKRCFSLFFMHITNGVVSLLFFFILLIAKLNGLIKNKRLTNIVLILLVFNLFATGARSVILAFFIMLLVFYNKRLLHPKYFILTLISIGLVYSLLGTYLYTIFTSIVASDKVEGSNAEMRDIQLEVALTYWNKSFFYGNGIGSIGKVMILDKSIAGAESLWFPIMVERGLIGLLVGSSLFVMSFVYCLKNRTNILCFFIVSILVLFSMTSVPNIQISDALFYVIIATILKKYHPLLK